MALVLERNASESDEEGREASGSKSGVGLSSGYTPTASTTPTSTSHKPSLRCLERMSASESTAITGRSVVAKRATGDERIFCAPVVSGRESRST